MVSLSAVFGIFLFLVSTAIGVFLTSNNILIYVNLVGGAVVFGGTIGASLIAFRWQQILYIAFSALQVLKRDASDFITTIKTLLKLADQYSSNPNIVDQVIAKTPESFLKDALVLLSQQYSASELKNVLVQQITHQKEREFADSKVLRTIAKWPPAFGMLGTLIGLIALMQDMAGESGFESLGPSMAVALITTLYGIVASNGILIPISEHLENKSLVKVRYCDMIMNGVVAIRRGDHPLKIQKSLNIFIPPRMRREWLKEL